MVFFLRSSAYSPVTATAQPPKCTYAALWKRHGPQRLGGYGVQLWFLRTVHRRLKNHPINPWNWQSRICTADEDDDDDDDEDDDDDDEDDEDDDDDDEDDDDDDNSLLSRI